MTDVVKVEQVDREAAANLIDAYWSHDERMAALAASYRAGHSQGVWVQAFARRRIAAQAEAASEIERLTRERDEAREVPWPKWVMECLRIIRDESGYDGYDDADGVDLPEELQETINYLRKEADKNTAEARASRKLDEIERGQEHYRIKVVELCTKLTAAEAEAASLRERLEKADETANFIWKWVERAIFDKQILAPDALAVIAHHPSAPWKNGRWDVDHKPYAGEFYAKFPKAAIRALAIKSEGERHD